MGRKKRKIDPKNKGKADVQKNVLYIKPDIELKDVLRERSINSKVIPCACSLKEVLLHLSEKNWNISKLKKYEKSCCEAYKLNQVLSMLKEFEEKYWPEIMKINVLSTYGEDIGANCAAIYLVGYVSEKMGIGEHMMKEYCKLAGITEKEICVKAIYNTGKNDGEYLGILNEDGTVADWDFLEKWVMG